MEDSIHLEVSEQGSGISRESLWSKAFYKFRHDTFGVIGFFVVLIYFLIACGVWGQLIATDWDEIQGDMFEPVSEEHWFGTNRNGQDVFSRSLYGTRVAFEVGITVAFLSTVLGAILGGLAGYFSGTWIDQVIIWIYGTLESIPFILFVAAISFALSDNPFAMHIAMILVFWVSTCTYIRGEFIKIKNLEYVESARAIGVPTYKIIFKHIMPNTYHILLVQMTIVFVAAIKQEVILSFLGLGIKDGVSWGLMFSTAGGEVGGGILNTFLAASGFMFFLVLAFNVFSDALQDALDPKKV
jgi:peptide/nickel transport system permease protein